MTAEERLKAVVERHEKEMAAHETRWLHAESAGDRRRITREKKKTLLYLDALRLALNYVMGEEEEE